MNQDRIQRIVREITETCEGRTSIRLMEVCGTHTVALFRSGVKSLLPKSLRLISGPGCPVCVTPQGYVNAACEVAGRPGVTVCTYGDMVRVRGRDGSLADCRGRGARIVTVYSARDALKYARQHPDEQVVFLAVGFETTAPTTAAVVMEAARGRVGNFFVLMGHKLALPAMMYLLESPEFPIDGFICPGHVSVVIGAHAYQPIIERYRKPCAVTGFEPAQMLEGILSLVRQVTRGEARVDNVYGAAVSDGGNPIARACMHDVFETAPATWRALGVLPESGLELREPYRRFDAAARFGLETHEDFEPPGCRCGEVLQGKLEPHDCGLFGTVCNPANPIGPCMVSSEGTCAAWYKYGPPKEG